MQPNIWKHPSASASLQKPHEHVALGQRCRGLHSACHWLICKREMKYWQAMFSAFLLEKHHKSNYFPLLCKSSHLSWVSYYLLMYSSHLSFHVPLFLLTTNWVLAFQRFQQDATLVSIAENANFPFASSSLDLETYKYLWEFGHTAHFSLLTLC